MDRIVKACLITNPRSGRGGIDLSPVLPVLEAHGWAVSVRQKQHDGDATEVAHAAAHAGYDVVVDCGGDGTLNEVIAGLVGTRVAVGALPGGTVNLWTKEVGISPRLDVAARQLVASVRHQVDVGYAAIDGHQRRYFLLMAGLGLDAAIMAHVSRPLKNHFGKLAVGVAALQALPSFGAMPVQVDLDGVHWQGPAGQIVIGNTRRYGGFTRITGDAYMDDGLLDVCLMPARGWASAGRQIGALVLRQHPSATEAETYRVSRVTIQAPAVIPLELDGSTVRQDADRVSTEGVVYQFSVVPRGLVVLVPASYSGELFQPQSRSPHELQSDVARAHSAPEGTRPKRHKRRLRVLTIGVDELIAAQCDDDKVFRVLLDAKTQIHDVGGKSQTVAGFLSTIDPGEIISVKGRRNHETGTIATRRIRRASGGDGTLKEP